MQSFKGGRVGKGCNALMYSVTSERCGKRHLGGNTCTACFAISVYGNLDSKREDCEPKHFILFDSKT
jgi:hypothetical protein